jgi:NAD(P)-dependent dehydrogenase (short-subunit alcohol dehydrogenase family)
MNMENEVVVITGGSSGFGRETALRLSRKNATVILVAAPRRPWRTPGRR